jgi:hypothetical protein
LIEGHSALTEENRSQLDPHPALSIDIQPIELLLINRPSRTFPEDILAIYNTFYFIHFFLIQ